MSRNPIRPLGLVLALLFALSCAQDRKPPNRVLLVILDTVRADHLSSYGYPLRTTPHLDRLAEEGERYERAMAQSSWTLPTVASILTGLPPHLHGAGWSEGSIFPLREGVPTLAEMLGDAGFDTAAIFNVVWCQPTSGLDRGFRFYDFVETDTSNRNHRSAGETTDLALDWLRGRAEDQPLFLVVHYFDPHLTYDPPLSFAARFEPDEHDWIPEGFGSAGEVIRIRRGEIRLSPRQKQSLIARYDGELAYTDQEFGRLRKGMEELGLWDDTLVIVVGDHGEEFWDHGSFEHGHSHYREVVHVPLIVRRPGGPSNVVSDDRVRQLDIVPTVLDHAGLDLPPDLPGQVLGTGSADYSIAEGSLFGGDLVSIRSDLGTMIADRSVSKAAYFGPDDAAERQSLPLADAEQSGLPDLLRALPPARAREDVPWTPTDEQLRQLRSLGYVE